MIETTHDPGDALLEFMQLEVPQNAIIIMGCRGRQGLRKVMLGSVSSYIAQYSPISILVVRSRKYVDIPDLTSDSVGASYLGLTAVGKQRKIAIAVDGSSTSIPLVKWAIKNCLKAGDEVHLLHSAASETPAQTLEATAEIDNCKKELEEFQKDSEQGTTTSVLLDMKGDLRDLIVDWISDMGGAIDLLVMGTRGVKGNLKRAVLGSVSSYCLSYANSPVLVVGTETARQAAGVLGQSTPTA